jgi:hypothetical protein
MSGESREWLPGLESENDWQCPECDAELAAADDSVKLLCVHCIRALREHFDPNLSGRSTPHNNSPPATSGRSDVSSAS